MAALTDLPLSPDIIHVTAGSPYLTTYFTFISEIAQLPKPNLEKKIPYTSYFIWRTVMGGKGGSVVKSTNYT